MEFKHFLERELIKRCQKNPGYSLRAFARSLKVDHSRLSKILKGDRPTRPELIEKLGFQLLLSPMEIEKFKKKTNPTTTLNYFRIRKEIFELISDPLHFEILALLKTKDFNQSVQWISKRTNRSVHEINGVITRLEKAGLLIRSEKDWQDTSQGFSTHIIGPTYTSEAHKRSQAAILKKAIQALQETPIEIRDQSSMTMAISTSKIREAKEKIKKFRRELCAFLEDSHQDCDEVYQLSISLFPTTNRSK